MMDHKTWLWKKKSTEKTLIAADKGNVSQRIIEEEILQTDKAELEGEIKILNDKLSSALYECNAKDELVEKHAKMAQEALAGWEKVESETMSLKQELSDVKRQRAAGEERITHLDMALKECMQQLRFVREEQEQRINDAIMKTSGEFEKTRTVLEEKLADTNRRLSKLGVDNTQLSKAILAKEKLIQDLNEQRTRLEVDLMARMTRLESTEKENTSLKYEVRVLEKELEIRNEEREFNRRTADVGHKQHLESVKKIAKLESECQRLRILVRKRLPGPAALAKMKNEVEILGRDQVETRRRNSNPSLIGSVDFAMDNFSDTPNKRLDYLVEKLCALEEENRSLKEIHSKKTSQIDMEPGRNIHLPYELSVASMSDIGSDDKVSCAESLASALISDLERLKNGKQMGVPLQKTVGASDINLMDDFVEMEKLAIVSTDKPYGSSHLGSVEGSEIFDTFKNQSVAVHSDLSGYGSWKHLDKKVGIIGNGISFEKKKQHEVQSNLNKSIRKTIDLIEGISLPYLDYGASVKDGSHFPYKNSDTPSGYIVRVFQWKTSELSAVLQQFIRSCNDLLIGDADFEKFAEELTLCLDWVINHCFSLQDVSSMREAIKKHFDWDESQSESEVEVGTPSQFSGSDKLQALKEKLSHLPCNDFKMEDIQRNLRVENDNKLPNMESASQDLEGRLQSEFGKSESFMIQLQESKETKKSLQRDLEALKESKGMIENQIYHHKLDTEIVRHDLVNADVDTQLKVARAELNEAQLSFLSLETEVENRSDCCEELEATCVDLQHQLESGKNTEMPKDAAAQEEKQLRTDWETTAASEKLAECQETILNLGKQLKELASTKDPALNPVSNPSDNLTTTTPKKGINQRSSLLDKILAEDNAEPGDLKFHNTLEVYGISDPQKPPAVLHGDSASSLHPHGKEGPHEMFLYRTRSKRNDNEAEVGSLAITPVRKKGGGGLFKKLLWRSNKGKSKKLTLPFAC